MIIQSINDPQQKSSAIGTTKATLLALNDILQIRSIQAPEKEEGLYLDLRQHRKEYYAVSAPHLLSDREQEIERNVDRRSVIYALTSGPTILSSLRLTERPFELEQFNLNFDFARLNNFLEIGRLVTNPRLDALTSALLVRMLLCGAGLDAIETYNCEGLAAICRPFRLSFFTKFGLQNHFSFFSEQRQIEYHFLTASMDSVLAATESVQQNEIALRKRLYKFFSEGA